MVWSKKVLIFRSFLKFGSFAKFTDISSSFFFCESSKNYLESKGFSIRAHESTEFPYFKSCCCCVHFKTTASASSRLSLYMWYQKKVRGTRIDEIHCTREKTYFEAAARLSSLQRCIISFESPKRGVCCTFLIARPKREHFPAVRRGNAVIFSENGGGAINRHSRPTHRAAEQPQ